MVEDKAKSSKFSLPLANRLFPPKKFESPTSECNCALLCTAGHFAAAIGFRVDPSGRSSLSL